MINAIIDFEVVAQHAESRFPAHLRPSKIEHHITLKKSLYAWIVARYMQQKIDETMFRHMRTRLIEWLRHNGFREEDMAGCKAQAITNKDISAAMYLCRFDDNLFKKGDINIITDSYDNYEVSELQDFEDLKFAFCEGWGITGFVDHAELIFRSSLIHVPIFATRTRQKKENLTAENINLSDWFQEEVRESI